MTPPKGIVLSYDSKEAEGIIKQLNKGEAEYPFRYRDGHFINNDGQRPIFHTSRRQRNSRIRLPEPSAGDLVIFQLNPHPGYAKACPWGYWDQWKSQLQLLSDLPTIRLMFIHNGKIDGVPMWEGTNVLELSSKFPKIAPNDNPRRVRDVLTDRRGGQITDYAFQVRGNGGWQEIADPREFACCLPKQVYKRFNAGKPQPGCIHHAES